MNYREIPVSPQEDEMMRGRLSSETQALRDWLESDSLDWDAVEAMGPEEDELMGSYFPAGIDYSSIKVPDPAPCGTFVNSLDGPEPFGEDQFEQLAHQAQHEEERG